MVVLFLFISCTKDIPAPDIQPNEADVQTGNTVNPNLLTNIFRGTPLILPSGCTPMERVQPYYDPETQTLRVLCLYGGSTMILATLDMDGNLLEERTLVPGEDPYPSKGVITADAIFFQHTDYNADTKKSTYYVMRYDLSDDTRTRSEDVAAMFEAKKEYFYVQQMTADDAGYVYLTSDSEIVVLDNTLQYEFTVRADSYISELIRATNGMVYINDRRTGIRPIDRTTGRLAAALGLPSDYSITQYRFGEGYDAYYSATDGLHGYNFASAEDVLLCNYENSDLYANNVNIAAILDPDRVLLYGDDGISLVLYKRSADIDLSEITTLEIAYMVEDADLSARIVEFNKQHPDIRVLTKDYSDLGGDSEQRLVNDLLTGIYTPDIVMGWSQSDNALAQIFKNHLYVDLYQYVDKTDLLGCARRIFESEDGKLMALSPTVSILTYVGATSVVGERTAWTLSEMLDFAESLPEGTRLMTNLNQDGAVGSLLGSSGYGIFIDTDNGTCDFDNEEFYRYLAYVKTLPATLQEASTMYENTPDMYSSGKVALKTAIYLHTVDSAWMMNYGSFGPEGFTNIGYASQDGEFGNVQTITRPYVITTFCEEPETAWEFVESLLYAEGKGTSGIPVLTSEVTKRLESAYGTYYEFYTDGSSRSYPPTERYDPEGTMEKPGFRMVFDDAEGKKILDWLENGVGLPMQAHMDTGLTNIIEEEISRYLGGMQTAEKCAEVLNSRVGLWLAEHN